MQLDPETLEVVTFATEPEPQAALLVGAGISEPDICHVWFSDCAACF
ncbi:MAG TPA: hypothetical protein VF665_09090 [Longimicrobium sp.]|jgi:hypothetical protein